MLQMQVFVDLILIVRMQILQVFFGFGFLTRIANVAMLHMLVSLTPDFVLSVLQIFVADSSSVLALLHRFVCLTPELVLPLWICPRRIPQDIAE